jgi:hypothetical protein
MRKTLIVLALLCAGCATGAYKVHPGSGGYVSGPATQTQIFVSQAYDTLSAADAVIVETRADFLANKFPAAAAPKVRTAFNALVTAYDAAQQAWLAFNASASAGGTATQNALSAALSGLNQALTGLASAKAGN